MKLNFYPYEIQSKTIENEGYVELYGKTDKGIQICVQDKFEPYFFAEIDNKSLAKKIEKIEIKEKSEKISPIKVETIKKNILGKEKELLKITCKKQSDILKIRNEIKHAVVNTYEFDLPYTRRYLVEKNIIPLSKVEIEVEEIDSDLKIKKYKILKLKATNEEIKKLNVMAIDIETYFSDHEVFNPKKNAILMISFYSENYKKVISWKKIPGSEHVKDEKELLKRFSEIIEEQKPDMITGYFSDGFDLPYIAMRAKELKVKLDIGMDNSEIEIKNDSAMINGIPHIDLLKFIRRTMSQTLETSTYTLDDVSFEVLKEKKLEVNIQELPKAWDSNDNKKLKEFVKYNLRDSELTYRLFEKIFPNLQAMVDISGLMPFDVNRMGFSQFVEWHIIRNTKDFNEIILRKPAHNELEQRQSTRVQGAYVAEPKPGLYEDIIVLDFTSLYPSIITSHNISLSSFKQSPKSIKNVNPDDKNLWFSEKKGFTSQILENLILMRSSLKKKSKTSKDVLLTAKVGMLKILVNSFYGYLGFYGARWYCLECAATTTAFARHYIKDVISKTEKEGYDVIYSDTDSVFFTLGDKTIKSAKEFLEKMNKELPGIMELDYEGYFPRGIFVSAKSGIGGAKKRYSLLKEKGGLKIVGFELVRRNTSLIAKEVQEKVLKLILEKNDSKKALDYVRKVIEDLKKKKISSEKLIIMTKITKDLKHYTATGPNVAIAKKMRDRGQVVGAGTSVKYIITEGKGKIRDKAELPDEVKEGEYDAEYYIEHQILPAVEQLFKVCGYEKDEILNKGKQTGLNKFF